MDKEIFNKLKNKFGDHSSFAFWNEKDFGDISMFKDDKVIKKLNSKYIFVGYNPANHNLKDKQPKLKNFHSSNKQKAHDYRLHFALKDTEYYGSYITDLFKFIIESRSEKVKPTEKDKLKGIQLLNEEIKLIGNNPTIIAMGDKAYTVLNKFKKKGTLNANKVIKIHHYSCYETKENYIKIVRKELKIK